MALNVLEVLWGNYLKKVEKTCQYNCIWSGNFCTDINNSMKVNDFYRSAEKMLWPKISCQIMPKCSQGLSFITSSLLLSNRL